MRWLAVAMALSACATVPPPSALSRARVVTADDADITVYRWGRGDGARRVLVVPELGFDHRIVTPLAESLRDAGFDVYAFNARTAPGGAAGFALDVAAALNASDADYLLATGVAGALALRAARTHRLKGALLVNVPFAFVPSNVALADALAAHGFDPSAWARTAAGPMLLGAGRATSSCAALAFEKLGVPIAPSLSDDIGRLFATRARVEAPDLAMRLLVGLKDNLVAARFALSIQSAPQVSAARRMGRIEGFETDVGHLEWLVDPQVLRDVAPVIVEHLEALP